MTDSVAYKVMTTDEARQMRVDGAFRGSPIDLADGFIHLSTGAQLAATVATHFAGRTDVVLAAVDLTNLDGAVRWEPSRGGQLFPHLYGALPMTAVIAIGPLERSADGALKLPS